MNELILIASLLVEFGLVLLAYRLFGKAGLYAMTVLCTVAANIEVMILVRAFGLDQTLGNILFACTFVITDILSENHGKDSANKAAKISIFVTAAFMLLTQSWLLYTPAAEDNVMDSVRVLFANTPRVMLSSLAVCAVTQLFDVWLYHKLWDFTTKKFGDSKKFLWLRNNTATLTSQLINAVLFTLGAFAGLYSAPVIVSIAASSYIIFAVTALLDTPVVYIARRMKEKYKLD
ncbi:MAG: queuosine precursor transporter [Clostridia bacterium]|nr:queuosine precursor transporter [Clostridia bacterium]